MAATSLTLSGSRPRFGRSERTEIRAHFARDVLADMKAAYFGDDRPWVVGFSGGKDSTALVQWLYYMLARLPVNRRRKHVYILPSDTRVEASYIPALDVPLRASQFGSRSDPWAKLNPACQGSARNRRELVRKCLPQLGLPRDLVYHGVRREIFVAPLARNSTAFLRGEHERLLWHDLPAKELFAWFRQRWLLLRAPSGAGR